MNTGALRQGVDDLVGRAFALASTATGRRLVAATLWAIVSEVLSRGLLFVGMISVARELSVHAYGEFGLVRSTITVFATVGGFGLGLTANRYVAEHRHTDRHFAGRVAGASVLLAVCAGAVVGGIVVAGAPVIATSWLQAPETAPSLRLAGLLLALTAVAGAQLGILQGLEAYRQLAFGSLVQGCVAVVALFIGAREFGLRGALLGLIAYAAISVVVQHLQLARALRAAGLRIEWRQLGETLPIFWAFSLPVMLAGVSIAPLKWIAELLLARRMGFADLGAFTAAMTVTTMLTAVVSTLNPPLLSLAAANASSGSRRVEYASYYASWYATIMLLTPLLLFPRVVSFIFGAQFNTPEFHRTIVLMGLYVALLMYYQGVARQLAVRGTMWFSLGTNLVEGAALLLAFALLSSYGAVGLAAAYVLSYVARIGSTLPALFRGDLVRRDLLFDRVFLVSALGLIVLICVQLMVLR